MIRRLKSFFEERGGAPKSGPAHDHEEKLMAAAVLMVEAARLDESFDAREQAVILNALTQYFDLSSDEAESLIEEASEDGEGANRLFGATQAIKRNFSEPERVELMELLWDVVYADDELHHYEANLLRRIAGLIYVTDHDSGLARRRALERRRRRHVSRAK